MPFQEIEHTADRLMAVESKTLDGLFAEAGKALSALYGRRPVKKGGPVKRIKVSLKAGALEDLLVAFLNEIIFRTEREKGVFDVSGVKVRKVRKGFVLTATIFGGIILPLNEIKSATYHDLKLERLGKGWRTAVVFDV